MLKRTLAGSIVAALILTVSWSTPVYGLETLAQPTELQPPDAEIPGLYPPESPYRGDANAVFLVDEVPVVSQRLRGIVAELGGWVTRSRSGINEFDGRRYEYATAVIDLPERRFEEFIALLDGLGQRILLDYSSLPAPGTTTVAVDVTLTDSAEPYLDIDGSSPPDGRVDRALNTAGDVLLTMLSILIVAGAVVIPIGLMTAFGYAIWRGLRRRWPIAELPVADADPILVDESPVTS